MNDTADIQDINPEKKSPNPVTGARGEEKSGQEAVPLDITVILDRSGSMDTIRDDAIGSFNAFLRERKEKNQESKMSLVLFDDRYEILQTSVPIQSVDPLNYETFIPRGSTALLDAIGRTIRTIEEREHEDEEVLVAVLTDGQENASVEYRLEQIRELIREKEAKDWDFVYLSADPSAFSDAHIMGFAASKTARFRKENIGEAYDEMNSLLEMKREKARLIKRMKEEDRNRDENASSIYQ